MPRPLLSTEYVTIDPIITLESTSAVVTAGHSATFSCSALTSRNYNPEWRTSSDMPVGVVSLQEGEEPLAVCAGETGVYAVIVESNDVPRDSDGAIIKETSLALVVCSASSELSNTYYCGERKWSLKLSVISPVNVTAVAVTPVAATLAILLLLIAVVVAVLACSYRILKPKHSILERQGSLRRGVYHTSVRRSIYHTLPFPIVERTADPLEFPRERLQLGEVVGEPVWSILAVISSI